MNPLTSGRVREPFPQVLDLPCERTQPADRAAAIKAELATAGDDKRQCEAGGLPIDRHRTQA